MLKFYSATCDDIAGDTSFDGVGTIINLGKINRIPCIYTSCSLSFSLYIVNTERITDHIINSDGEHTEMKPPKSIKGSD